MRIGPITLFKRQHSNGEPINCFTVVSLHWKWSLTWRWSLSWSPEQSGETGLHCMRTHRYNKGLNFRCVLSLPGLGTLDLQTQPNMMIKRVSPSVR